MSVRDIIIGGDENGEGGVGVFRGTSLKDSPEYGTDMIKCFDENVNQGSDVIGGTLEIEKLKYDSYKQYTDLRDKLKEMTTEPAMISTFERIKFKGDAAYIIQKNYTGCLVTGKDSEDNPGEIGTLSLSFSYEECIEKDPVEEQRIIIIFDLLDIH